MGEGFTLGYVHLFLHPKRGRTKGADFLCGMVMEKVKPG